MFILNLKIITLITNWFGDKSVVGPVEEPHGWMIILKSLDILFVD